MLLELKRLELLINSCYKEDVNDIDNINNKILEIEKAALDTLNRLKYIKKDSKDENCKLFKSIPNDEFNDSIHNRIFEILKYMAHTKKAIITEQIRDTMGSLKYELLEKHSNFSNIDRNELEKEVSLRDQWESYREKIIKGTKYFYLEEEQSLILKKPLEYSKDDVFPKL